MVALLQPLSIINPFHHVALSPTPDVACIGKKSEWEKTIRMAMVEWVESQDPALLWVLSQPRNSSLQTPEFSADSEMCIQAPNECQVVDIESVV